MDCKYRGSIYQTASPQLDCLEKKLIGRYRGQNFYRAIYDTSSIHQGHPCLTYRGVTYGSKMSPTTIGQAQENAFKIQVTHRQKPILSSRHQVMSELDRVHNQFLLKKLEQRMSAAREKGDRDLVQMLEREKHQLQ